MLSFKQYLIIESRTWYGLPIRNIPLDQLRPTEKFQRRKNVKEISALYRSGEKLPPIRVIPDKKGEKKYQIEDGHHRYRSHLEDLKKKTIKAVVLKRSPW